MEPEKPDYENAISFLNGLHNIALNEGHKSIKDIKKVIKDYGANPLYAIDLVKDALCGLKKYNTKDLESLATAGFNISTSVIHNKYLYEDKYLYEAFVKEFKQHLMKINKPTKKFLKSSKGDLKMFSKFLRAYADISEYETKVSDEKTEALISVLANK